MPSQRYPQRPHRPYRLHRPPRPDHCHHHHRHHNRHHHHHHHHFRLHWRTSMYKWALSLVTRPTYNISSHWARSQSGSSTFLTVKSFDNSQENLENSFKRFCHMFIMIGFHVLHEEVNEANIWWNNWNCRGFRRDSEMLDILEIMHYLGQALLL